VTRRWVWHIARLCVCASGLAFVIVGLEWDQVELAWQRSDKVLLATSFIIFLPVLFVQSQRFAWMLRAQGIALGYWDSLKLSCTGNFLNNFVPAGLVGGDVVKAYYVAQRTVHKTEAVTAVVLDRIVGLMVLTVIALVGLCIELEWATRHLEWFAGGLCAGLVLLLVTIILRRALAGHAVERFVERLPAADHLRRVTRATLRLREHWPLTIAALASTLVAHTIILTSFVMAAIAVGMSPHVVSLFAFLAISLLIAAIPISPAGLGTMEASMTVLMVGAGLGDKEQVLLLAMAMRAIQLLWSLPGGAMFAMGACRMPPALSPRLEPDAAVEP